MSDLKVDGFKSSDALVSINDAFANFTDAERQTQIKKTAAIFELHLTNAKKEKAIWTVDLKDKCVIYKGPAQGSVKVGVTLIMHDDVFIELAEGRTEAQKAFMTGKLKTKGNVMFATKLPPVLEFARSKTNAKAKL